LTDAKRGAESATRMVQAVLPNDANPLGYILGGTVMHLIDMAGAIAAIRHTRSLLVTAAVDGLQFPHPIKVGDLIILEACVTAVWSTSLEVEVEFLGRGRSRENAASRAALPHLRHDRSRRAPQQTGSPTDSRNGRRASARRGSGTQARAAP
jgi:acyl-CoA hydrolase